MNNEKFGKLTKEYPKKNQQDFSKNRSVLKKKRLEQASEVKPRKNLGRSFYNLKFFLKKLAKWLIFLQFYEKFDSVQSFLNNSEFLM